MDPNSDAVMKKKTHSKEEATREHGSRRKNRPGVFGKAYEAKDECRTKLLLNNAINFINRPESWLENAEWYHLEEY